MNHHNMNHNHSKHITHSFGVMNLGFSIENPIDLAHIEDVFCHRHLTVVGLNEVSSGTLGSAFDGKLYAWHLAKKKKNSPAPVGFAVRLSAIQSRNMQGVHPTFEEVTTHIAVLRWDNFFSGIRSGVDGRKQRRDT